MQQWTRVCEWHRRGMMWLGREGFPRIIIYRRANFSGDRVNLSPPPRLFSFKLRFFTMSFYYVIIGSDSEWISCGGELGMLVLLGDSCVCVCVCIRYHQSMKNDVIDV